MNKHPGGVYEVPTLYDISGSAHFYNKADYGLSIYRLPNSDNTGYINSVQVHVQKVKFKHLGENGMVELRYNYNNGRFESDSVDTWDNSNWLVNGPIELSEDVSFGSINTNEAPF